MGETCLKKHCSRCEAAVCFIVKYKLSHDGNSPSVREVGAAIGLSSVSTTMRHLTRLVGDGRLLMDGKRSLSIPGGAYMPPPWLALEPAVTSKVMQFTAAIYGVELEAVVAHVLDYHIHFRRGPAAFWDWYSDMKEKHRREEFPFKPYYPHEVYPELARDGDWFYEAKQALHEDDNPCS